MAAGPASSPQRRSPGTVGEGPAALAERVLHGEITIEQAERTVRDAAGPEFDPEAERLAARARDLARNDPLAAIVPGRIAAAAVDTDEPERGREGPWVRASLAWADIAGRASVFFPDARMQRHAAARGERVRRWAETSGRGELRAQACLLIAALALRLHQSPGGGYEELDDLQWFARLYVRTDGRIGHALLGPGTMAFRRDAVRPPPWEQAAWVGEAHLREALAIVPGDGVAAAELASLLAVTGVVDPGEPRRLAAQALLSARGLASARIRALQRQLGVPLDLGSFIADLDQIQVGSSVAELGRVDASMSAAQVLGSLRGQAPEAALAWVRRWEPLFAACGHDKLSMAGWFLRAEALGAALRLRTPAETGLEQLKPEERLLIAALDGFNAQPPTASGDLFAQLNATSCALVAENRAALIWMEIQAKLTAVLELDRASIVRLLPPIIISMFGIGLRWWPFLAVTNITAQLDEIDPRDIGLFVDCLEQLAIPMERTYQNFARELVHEVAMHVTTHFFGDQAPEPADIVRLFQVAGGARYAAGVQSRAAVDPAGDTEVASALTRVRYWERLRDAQATGPGGNDGSDGAPDDRWESTPPGDEWENDQRSMPFESRLTSYASGAEQSDGADPEAVLGNVQMRADTLLDARLLAAIADDAAPCLSLEQLQASLDERTAVLLTFFGRFDPPKGPPLVVTAIVSRDTLRCSGKLQENLPGDARTIEPWYGGIWNTSALGLTVSQLRRLVQQYPGPDLMTEEAAEVFGGDWQVECFLGDNVRDEMARLRTQGVDHLCIVPYGPLRVAPMHLLGAPGRMLADDWVVTYLPHATLLGQHPPGPARSVPVASVGLNYAVLGMASPADAAVNTTGQARTIAEMFMTEPILDAEATPAAIIRALQTARRVHLAAHGEMNLWAPAFQAIQVAPGRRDGDAHAGRGDGGDTEPVGDNDGRLHAVDLMGLDLAGLELVTLSACESALVRFDPADNPRGLPPTLLLRGARAVVGTLWPVQARVAATFFPALYRDLSGGSGTLDAYRMAQATTRREHPALRDWGAFYFMGNWS